MARMTVLNFRSRAALDGAVFAVAVLGFASLSAPLAAQDLRDIPQKSTTGSITGPAPQPKSQPKQGREVQGPPAPLETQLRDTPPDEPVFRAPVSQPQPQATPVAPTVTRTAPRTANPATPTAAPAERAAAGRSTSAPQPRTAAPTASAPVAGNAVTGGEGAAAPALGQPATGETGAGDASNAPASDLTSFPTSPTDNGATTATDVSDEGIVPDADTGTTLHWALGGAALLGLGGLAYVFTRRRKDAPVAAAAGYGGIELGQTPFADELSESDASAPITNALKAPKPKAPAPAAPAAMRAPARMPAQASAAPAAPAMAAPPPPPEPVKPTADGRIVSRIKAPTGDAHIPADPQAAPPPPPRASQPSEPVKPASDGRIVSRLKVSDIVDEPAPPPPPQRRRPPPPSVKTVSVGYSVNKRG